MIYNYFKSILAIASGWLWAALAPAIPFAAVCSAMVLVDVVSARRLAKRIGKHLPEHKEQLKFSSARFGRVFNTLIKVYTALLLAAMVQSVILSDAFDLLRCVAAAICFWQAVSILENEASCNSHSWARLLSKILIDKTERYLGISLDEIKEKK